MLCDRGIILIRLNLQRRWAVLTGLAAVFGTVIGVGTLLILPLLIDAFAHQRTLALSRGLDSLIDSLPLLGACGVIIFAFGSFLGVYFSHRVAGPIFRLETVLEARNRGEPTGPIRLRPKDELQRLAYLLNAHLEREDELRENVRELMSALDPGAQQGKGTASPTIAQSEHGQLRECLRRLR